MFSKTKSKPPPPLLPHSIAPCSLLSIYRVHFFLLLSSPLAFPIIPSITLSLFLLAKVALSHILFPSPAFTSPNSLYPSCFPHLCFPAHFPLRPPHDLCLPPSHTRALPPFLCLLFPLPALCECVCVCFPLTDRERC